MVISFFLQCAIIVNLYPWWYNLVMIAASKRAEWLIPTSLSFGVLHQNVRHDSLPCHVVLHGGFQIILTNTPIPVSTRRAKRVCKFPWGAYWEVVVLPNKWWYAIFIYFFFCPSVMQHNTIEDILGRGEKLDDLVDKSEGLTLQSKAFYKTVSEIKRVEGGWRKTVWLNSVVVKYIKKIIHIVWCFFFYNREWGFWNL